MPDKMYLPPGIDEAVRLRERVKEIMAQLRTCEEAEASVCPEGVGVVEYVGSLCKRIKKLEAEIAELRKHRVVEMDCARCGLAVTDPKGLDECVTCSQCGQTLFPYAEVQDG